ncbi:MAG: GGDEF domain-containing protein [Clostridiales bacterium]|nr:GGDEF domain-containing protein [Clostridiales bacterium]
MIHTYLALYIMDILALIFLLVLLYSNNRSDKQHIRLFSHGIIFTVLVILAEIGTIAANEAATELRSLNIVSNVIGFALTPVIPIALTAIFDTKTFKKLGLLLFPTLVNVAAVVLSPLFGWIFYVDEVNHYARGPLFFIFVAVYIFNILILLIRTLYACQKSLYPIKWKIISLFLFTIAGSFIQLIYPAVYVTWHGVTLSLFLLYILLIEFDGSFDILTQLYNRAAFVKALKQLRAKKAFSMIVMDLNDFKEINDMHGHDYGDEVLSDVASIIRSSFDDKCSWYRTGGDEFCVIRRDSNEEKLKEQLNRLTQSLMIERQNNKNLPTVSYGYSIFAGNKILDVQTILKKADEQMYFYKNLHKSKKH